jgi:potassium-transporting ATPase ATP-binding subunit
MKKKSLFNMDIYKKALVDSLIKLDPTNQIRKPVMFIVYICSFVTTYITITQVATGKPFMFDLQITLWLWFTLLFANFSEAIAEGQGKARADSLKKSRTEIIARKISAGSEVRISANELKIGDVVVCEAGDMIPCDGEVIEGIASIDESAITGESAPVIRESGGDRSSVTIGTRVISDRIVVKVVAEAGNSFLDRMIKMIEGAKRQKTPNEIALIILLSGLTIIFLITVVTLFFFYNHTTTSSGLKNDNISITILVSLLVCLIPTTIGGLLNAIGISGMDRLLDRNIIATSGKAVEASGDIDVILLDKTGTITYGNRMADELIPAPGVDMHKLSYYSFLSSLSDDTPEGKSIIRLVSRNSDIKEETFAGMKFDFIPFSANTRTSGVEYTDDRGKIVSVKKGACEAIKEYVKSHDGIYPHEVDMITDGISRKGGTPLVVILDNRVLGVIYLKDIIKKGIKERFARLRKMGIKTVMITGDNPLTAATIAAEAGVDDFIAQANPESKLKRIREEQENGHLVAMIGDGTNDAPALAQADVGVVMNSGTQTAKEAGNMVDLDNNPTKLIEVVETGKQLLMTRGALTTFSVANDIAKYFAIIPAMFANIFLNSKGQGALAVLNIMHLASPESAILSSVIFNALIIIALIPLALKGVKYRPIGANPVLLRNLLIYGLGGIVAPFIGIKIIDIIINFLGVV